MKMMKEAAQCQGVCLAQLRDIDRMKEAVMCTEVWRVKVDYGQRQRAGVAEMATKSRYKNIIKNMVARKHCARKCS